MFVAQRGQDFTLSYSHGVSSSQKASLADLEKAETTWNCMLPPATAIATQRVQQCRRACRVEIGSFEDGFMVNQTAWQVFLFNLFMLFLLLVSLDPQICSRTEKWFRGILKSEAGSKTAIFVVKGEFQILSKMTTPLSQAFAALFAMDGSKLDETWPIPCQMLGWWRVQILSASWMISAAGHGAGGDEERSDFNFQKLSTYRQQDNVSIDIKLKW